MKNLYKYNTINLNNHLYIIYFFLKLKKKKKKKNGVHLPEIVR